MTRDIVDSSQFAIGATLAASFGFIGQNFWPLSGLLLQAIILALAFDVPLRQLFGAEIADAFISLIVAVAFAPVSVAIHRSVVLNQPLSPSHYFLKLLQPRVWKFIGYGLLASLIIGVAAVLGFVAAFGIAKLTSSTPETPSSLAIMTPMIVVLIIVAYLFRFVFIFPGIATDEFRTFRESRRLMQGIRWKVLTMMLIMLVSGSLLAGSMRETDIFAVWVFELVLCLYWSALIPTALSLAYKSASRQ